MANKYLNEDEIKIIEGTDIEYEKDNSRLTDKHMDAFIKLVSKCSPFNIQSPLYLQVPENITPIDLNRSYIQLLFSGPSSSGHWICMFYNNKTLHIYDSLNNNDLYAEHKVFLNRLFPNKNGLRIVFEKVTMQNNNYDCGVFTIASLIFNICPCLLNFKLHEMLKHLVKMFAEDMIYQFPHYSKKQVTNFTRPNLNHAANIAYVSFANMFANCDILQIEKKHVQFYKNESQHYKDISSTTDIVDLTLLNTTIRNLKSENKKLIPTKRHQRTTVCPNKRNNDLVKDYNKKHKQLHNEIFKIGLMTYHNSEIFIEESQVNELYLGEMCLICEHCNAKHFDYEYNKDKSFPLCCCKGKIILQPDNPYQDVIKNMCMSKGFLRCSRSYNNDLALASFTTKLISVPGRGPQVVRTCGQLYHNFSSLHPIKNDIKRNYGQLYIIESDIANTQRLQHNLTNSDYSLKTLEVLDKLLRKINPYVQSYKMM